MKTKLLDDAAGWVRRLLCVAAMGVFLVPVCGLAQTNLSLGFSSPATNASPGASFTGTLNYAPTTMVITASVTAGTNIVPQSNLSLNVTSTSTVQVTLAPLTNRSGQVSVAVEGVAGGTTSTVSFAVVFRPYPPSIGTIANRTILEDRSTNVAFVVSDPDTALSNLVLTASSSNTGLLNSAGMLFSSDTGSNRYIALTPRQDINGTSVVTIAVSDGSATNSRSFTLTVSPVGDPSTITGMTNSLFGDNAGVTNVFAGIVVDDVDHNMPNPEQLVATAFLNSDQFAKFSNNQITYSRTGTPAQVTAAIANLGLQAIPFRGSPGTINNVSASVRVRGVTDAISVTNSITLSIMVMNSPPSFNMLLNPTSVVEGVSAQPFHVDYVYDPDVGDETFSLSIELVNTNQGSLIGIGPTTTLTDNPDGLQSAIRNISVFPSSGVMTNATEPIALRFTLTDGNGGSSMITNVLTLVQQQNAPLITGVPEQTLNKTDADPAFTVYPTVFIQDPDQGGQQQVMAVLSQTMPSLGTLSVTNISFTTPAQLSVLLQGVIYTPASGALPVGSSAQSTVTLTVTDIAGQSAVNSSVKIHITSVNNAPRILNLPPPEDQPVSIPPSTPLRPFANLRLSNDDTNQVLFTLAIDNVSKGSLGNLGGFSQASPGVFQMTGFTNAIISSLTNITYTLNPAYLFPPDDPGGTTFTLSARDYALLTTTRTLYIQVQSEPRNHLVTRTQNDGQPGSFTYALANAGNNDVITFALSSYPATVRMPGISPSTIIRNMTIKGPGANLLTISGDGNGDSVPDRQIFRIRSRVIVEGITFSHGMAAFGGAMLVENSGFLTLRRCAVVDSVASQYGGAIDVDGGQLTLDGCFIGRNRLLDDSGVSGAGVSVYSDKDIRIINTTFSGNVQPNGSGDGGGALVVQNRTPSTPMSAFITHSTFFENVDESGQASAALSVDFGSRIRIQNSVFSDFSGRSLGVAGTGEFISLGGNVCDDSTRTTFYPDGLLNHVTDETLTDPLLAPMSPSSQPTPFREPLPGSPAIGKGVATTISVDQRGVLRQGTPDAGAIEFGALGRLVVNEIFFDGSAVNFVEIFVPRDSTPVNLAPYSLFVDGMKVHDFSGQAIIGTNSIYSVGDLASPLVNPGFGLLVAFTNGPFMLTSQSNITPVVGTSVTNATRSLPQQGVITIGAEGREPIVRQSYLGVYLNPSNGTNLLDIAGNSISLAPQFRGFALVPHQYILPGPFSGADLSPELPGLPTSAGSDSSGTPFGQDNAEPLARADRFTVTEDDVSALDVLLNDYDSDGTDRLVITDVSSVPSPGAGDVALTNSVLGASIGIDPDSIPLRGSRIFYDPRVSQVLQSIPVGVEAFDTFSYGIIDIGSAPVGGYSASGTNTAVTSFNHRLKTNDEITFSGVSHAPYNQTFAVTVLDENTFTIPVEFDTPVAVNGNWESVLARTPTARSEGLVTVRVIGVNDSPVAGPDVITNVTETATVRIMTRPELAGSSLTFPGDPVPSPVMSAQNVLDNDTDIDTDDTWASLRVVGVLAAVNEIAGYSGTRGEMPVTVHAPAHGLTSGDEILVANFGGHPSVNGYHTVTVLDADRFSIARFFVDDHPDRGVWVRLDESNRYGAVTDVGAVVTLTLRADPLEDHIIYSAASSAFLQGLAEGELYTNRFYYAVEDSHGGIGIGPVDVIITGLNNTPAVHPDPGSLAQLLPLISGSNTLEEVLSGGLDLMYTLPPASGTGGVTDLHVLDLGGVLQNTLVLHDFFVTDEDTPLSIATLDLLANDTDIDRIDALDIIALDVSASRLNASLSLVGGVVNYDPTVSSNLQSLVREEMVVDTFSVVVSDGMTGGTVTSLVAVLVIGVNDTPVAQPVSLTTHEDEVLVFDPRFNDRDMDINGIEPDDRLGIVPVADWPNPGQARVDMSVSNVTHDATASAFLNQLADWQSFTNVYSYTITDNSFLFAVDDEFYIPFGAANRILDVLANDRDFTGADGVMRVVEAGPSLHGGVVTIHTNGQYLVYSAPVAFVGDDYFRYIIRNERGVENSGRVMVRSVVPPINGVLCAADDAFTVAAGETVSLDVLANDSMLPQAGAGLTIVSLVASSIPGQPILTNNMFVFTATNGLVPLEFTYEVSAGGPSTARADVLVNIVERRGTLRTRNDSISVLPGSFNNELDVLANDGLVTESIANLRIKAILDPAIYGTVTTNAAGTRLIYTPLPAFVGTEAIRYLATDQIGGTGTGLISITVGRIEAVSDFFTIAASTNPVPVALAVLANDRMMPNPQGTLTILAVDPAVPVSIGSLQVGGAGTNLLFTPSNVVGQMEFTYVVQDAGIPARTATGRVTISTVPSGIYANPDRYVVRGGGSGYILPVLANDISYPSANKSYSILGIGTGADAPDGGGQVIISGNTLVYTPAPGFFGQESFTYNLSDSVATDVARVTISVRRGDLFANDDDYTIYFENEPGTNLARRFTLPVLLNDRIHPALDQSMQIVSLGTGSNAPSQGGLVSISADNQALLYRPVLVPSPAYVDQFTYEISDGGDRRVSGVVRVRVENRAGSLVALTGNDAFTVARNSTNNVLPVLANDFVLPGSAASWTVTSVSATVFGGMASISGNAVRYTPPTGFVGLDSFTCNVSDGFGGTGSSTVRVKVGSLPTLPDLFTVLSGSTNNEFDVVRNDILDVAYAGEYMLHSLFGTTAGGTTALTASNTVLYTPDPAYAGSYPYAETFFYRVADDSGGMVTGQVQVIVHEEGSDRSTSTISLLVEGRNDQPSLTNNPPNLPITDKQTSKPFLEVTIIEVDEQLTEPVDILVTLDVAGKGILSNLGGFADLGGGAYALTNVTGAAATLQIRDLVFEPTENRITVPTSETAFFTVSVTDNKSPVVLDTNTAIEVTAVNDPPVISGTQSGQEFYYRLPIQPFSSVTITEVDDLAQQALSVKVTVMQPANGSFGGIGDFVQISNGVYAAAGITAADATAQLRAMAFFVDTAAVPFGGTQLTQFRITANDGFAAPVDDLNTSVIAHHPFETSVRPASVQLQGSFGLAVDTIADYAVVGAPNASASGTNSGVAFIYQRVPGTTNTWVEWRQLQPTTVSTNDRFGRSVSMTEDRIAVGAINDDAGGADVGAVYLFERDLGGTNNWGGWTRIVPTNLTPGGRFGLSVALNGDLLAVGAPDADLSGTGVKAGAVLLFGRHEGGTNAWGEIRRWAPSDAGSSNALFGWSVSLSGDRLVVGAPQYNTAGSAAVQEGAVFYLSRDHGGTGQWGRVQTITAVATNLSREFGWEVSVDGDLLAVGAPAMTVGTVTNAGRVLIYEKTAGTNAFSLVQELERSSDSERRFGHSVSVSGSQVFVGAPHNSGALNIGAAYLFDRPDPAKTIWTLVEKFSRPSGSTAGLFGTAVRYQRGSAIVGAPAQLDELSNRGYAFMYRFGYNTVPAISYSLTINPSLRWHGNSAASGQGIEVIANAFWTSTRSLADSWITITSGSSGGGNGTVTYSVESNGVSVTRSGTITISGGGIVRSFTVNQVAADPVLAISPSSRDHSNAAAAGQAISVTGNVAWVAAKTSSWITITGGTTGTNGGTVTYSISTNSALTARSGIITVSGGGLVRSFTVNQEATAPSLAISPASRDHAGGAVSGQTIGVTANVPWSAVTTSSWISVTGGASGTNNGTVTYSITANAVTTPRSGTITVSGGGFTRTFTVNQAAATASLVISPTAREHSIAANTGQTISVTANVSWTAVATSSWITVTGGASGSGGGTVVYSVDANMGVSSRSGAITVSGGGITRVFTVSQSGSVMYPSGGQVLEIRRPAFTWLAVTGATWYQLWISRDGATHSTPWVEGATTWTPPGDLPAGSYSWWVRAWGPVIGFTAWSVRADFTVAAMVPGAIVQIGPSGAQGGSNPVFRWAKDAKATWYHLWVSHPNGGTWHDKWYAMAGTGEGSVTVNGHPGGSSTWWIQGWGADGTGPWAGPMAFSTPDPAPAKPELIAPLGTVTSPVTFQYASARAEWYRIYVSRSGTMVIDQWTTSTTLNAGALSRGTYSWWVAGWNAVSGKTVWSDRGDFSIP